MTKIMIDADALLDWIEVQSKKNYAKTFNSFFTSADFIKQEITRLKSLATPATEPQESIILNGLLQEVKILYSRRKDKDLTRGLILDYIYCFIDKVECEIKNCNHPPEPQQSIFDIDKWKKYLNINCHERLLYKILFNNKKTVKLMHNYNGEKYLNAFSDDNFNPITNEFHKNIFICLDLNVNDFLCKKQKSVFDFDGRDIYVKCVETGLVKKFHVSVSYDPTYSASEIEIGGTSD